MNFIKEQEFQIGRHGAQHAVKSEIWNSNSNMDTNFVAAIYLINMGKYDKAAEYIRKAIADQEESGNVEEAIKFTCVLAELLAKTGDTFMAREEFNKVLKYCNKTGTLSEQREIALGYLNQFEANAQKAKSKKKAAAEEKPRPRYSDGKPNTTQTTFFLQ